MKKLVKKSLKHKEEVKELKIVFSTEYGNLCLDLKDLIVDKTTHQASYNIFSVFVSLVYLFQKEAIIISVTSGK